MQQTDAALERLQRAQGARACGSRSTTSAPATRRSATCSRFPIDILKIAKPFVDDVGQGADRSALARAIVGLGDTLKLRTIAEGIELAEQRAALLELGCELGQGHYFCAGACRPAAMRGAARASGAGCRLVTRFPSPISLWTTPDHGCTMASVAGPFTDDSKWHTGGNPWASPINAIRRFAGRRRDRRGRAASIGLARLAFNTGLTWLR